MDVELAIKNCRIVSSRATVEGTLYISEGKIAGITRSYQGGSKEVIDAEGYFVLPGGVDGHIHMMDPGFTEREDFTTGTRAAARGGVTTVIELPNQSKPMVFTAKGLEEKIQYLSPKAVVDFGLMGWLNLEYKKELKGMWDAGALGFKGFTTSRPGEQLLLAGPLVELFEEMKTFDGVALIHAEDDSLLKYNERKLKEAGRKDPLSIREWRSPAAESLALRQVIDVAEAVGARVAIAHVSQPDLLQYIWQAKGRGAKVYSETCPQYFTLTEDDLAEKGPLCKFTPPMRGRDAADGIWKKLGMGQVDMVNSDHAPFPKEVKAAGLENIWEAPFGIPGVETTTRLLLDGVTRGFISLNQVAALRSENAAAIYGLADRKGYLQVGYDADLILVDLSRETVLDDQDIVSKCKWTPYSGRKIRGEIAMTMVGGKVVMKDGQVSGVPGDGKFVNRSR